MNVYCIVVFKFNYSVGDIKNSDLGEGIVCLGEGSGGKGEGSEEKGEGMGREVRVRGEEWGMPNPLSTPSILNPRILTRTFAVRREDVWTLSNVQMRNEDTDQTAGM